MIEELTVAREAAERGGDIISHYFRHGVSIRAKETYNLVSDADVEAEHAIVDVIRRSFPDHAIMAEENHATASDAEHLWVVDPLDGTNNFAHHIPHFAVSIAYYRAGVAECGVIYHPLREDWYTVMRGGGARHNGQRVQVATHGRLQETLIGVGFYYDRGAMMEATLWAIRDLFRQHIHGIRRFGTASLDLCMVATGMFGAFFEYQLSPWDFGAGALFVEEAGGRVTTCRGEKLPLAPTSLLATNGLLHDDVLAIVNAHHPAGPGTA